MVTIKYDTAYCKVSSESSSEERLVHDAIDNGLAIRVPGYFFTPAYQKGFWDGFERYFNRKTGRFPTGLLARVLRILRDIGVDDAHVVGFPESWPGWDEISEVSLNGITLRDYQTDCIKQILKYHRGIVKVATNGGKTEIWAGLMKVLGSPPSIFYVPRKEIFKQTVDRFEERLGHPVGMVGDGLWEPNPKGITVVMYHTMDKVLHSKGPKMKETKKWLKSCYAVAADECHMLSADGYREAFDATGGDFRVGMSGTPFNKDKAVQRARLIGATGAVLADVTNKELIERGVSVKPNVLIVTPRTDPAKAKWIKHQDYRQVIHEHEYRNQAIATIARAFVRQGMQTMIMVSRTVHGIAIKEWLEEGVLVTSATGNRKEVRARLERGDVFACICTSIFDTGLSVDHIQGMINASEGSSEQTILQRLGRSVRRPKGYEKNLWFVDFNDVFNEYTKRHSRDRIDTYIRENAFNIVQDWRQGPFSDQDRYELLRLLM